MESLATSGDERIPQLDQAVFERLRIQARLQRQARGWLRPPYEFRPPDPQQPRRGLALLPPPSPNDVFFDLEGYPLAEQGLEYLWGAVEADGAFHEWWAHDQDQERGAFEQFVDWAYDRWRADRSMHIYHYAAYEVSALRRLMGKHASREAKVDVLLRHHVFVDLYNVVLAADAVDPPMALHEPLGVPRQVDVDDVPALLEVHALREDVRGDEDVVLVLLPVRRCPG